MPAASHVSDRSINRLCCSFFTQHSMHHKKFQVFAFGPRKALAILWCLLLKETFTLNKKVVVCILFYTILCLFCFSELSKREKHLKTYDDTFYNLRVDGVHIGEDKDPVLQFLFAWHPNIINCLYQKSDEVLYLYVAFYFN